MKTESGPRICSDRFKHIAKYQKSLGDTIVLLLEIKNQTVTSLTTKIEIENKVEELQEIIRELPNLTSICTVRTAAFEAIYKLVGIWQRISGK